jgi:hypothetical protein
MEKTLVITGILLTVLIITVGIPLLFVYIQIKKRKEKYDKNSK